MRKLTLLLLLSSCAPPASPAASIEEDLTLYGESLWGNLSSLHRDPDDAWSEINPLKSHYTMRLIPQMSTGVYSRAGDNLAITASFELQATTSVALRAVVDGVVAEPGEIIIKIGSTNEDGARSFTFVHRNLTEGQHVVAIECAFNEGATVKVRRRSLAVRSASSTFGLGQLAVASSNTSIFKSLDVWNDMAGMSANFTSGGSRTLAVQFSAYAIPEAGRLRVRSVVDGVAEGDTVLAEAGDSGRGGARSFTFIRSVAAAGNHNVRIQWRVENGSARIVGRTLTVEAMRGGTGGSMATRENDAPASSVTSTWFTDLDAPVSFTTSAADSVVHVLWTGEARVSSGSGDLRLRALVDGSSSEHMFVARGGGKWRAASASFAFKNLTPGSHTITVQAAVESGTSAYVGDRAFRVLHVKRAGSDFAQERLSAQPEHQSYNVLVICMDPGRTGHPRPTAAQVRGHFDGSDGGLNLKAWLKENTGSAARLGAFMFRGCEDGNWYQPPPAHRGTWYWDAVDENDERFPEMRKDALRAADPDFDFHTWDFNHDGSIQREELNVYYVLPQARPYGAAKRSVTLPLGGSDLKVIGVDMYLSLSTSYRREGAGVLAHESSHAFFDTSDLYCGNGDASFSPGSWNIMDWHGEATHLDPFHKLKLGFVTADLAELPTLQTMDLALPAVELQREILIVHDPAHGDDEYFLVEYRWSGAGPYDALRPTRVLVWHVFEDLELGYATRPADADAHACGEKTSSNRLVAKLAAGQSFDPIWSNGATTNLRISVTSFDNELANIRLVRTNQPDPPEPLPPIL